MQSRSCSFCDSSENDFSLLPRRASSLFCFFASPAITSFAKRSNWCCMVVRWKEDSSKRVHLLPSPRKRCISPFAQYPPRRARFWQSPMNLFEKKFEMLLCIYPNESFSSVNLRKSLIFVREIKRKRRCAGAPWNRLQTKSAVKPYGFHGAWQTGLILRHVFF